MSRMTVDVSAAHFATLVADALDSIPEDIAARMDNVAVVVDDFAPPGRLLGLYEGVPLTRRANYGEGGMVMPDRITIFRRSICALCNTDQEVVDQVRVTVIHEVGHHFGISDARLHELGWAYAATRREHAMSRFSISAIGADRPGIVAAVTSVLGQRQCNIEDTAMSILGGHFSMMLVVSGPSDLDAATLDAALTPVATELHLVTMVRAIDAAVAAPSAGELWTVSVHGADHPGIVHGVATALADMNVNVVDLATRVVPGDGGPAYVMVLDVTLPPSVDGADFSERLNGVCAGLGVACNAYASEADIL